MEELFYCGFQKTCIFVTKLVSMLKQQCQHWCIFDLDFATAVVLDDYIHCTTHVVAEELYWTFLS